MTQRDFRGIDSFERANSEFFHRGFVFYTGAKVLPFGPNRWAIPFAALRQDEAPGSGPVEHDRVQAIADRVASKRHSENLMRSSPDSLFRTYQNEIERQLSILASSIEHYSTDVGIHDGNVALTVTTASGAKVPLVQVSIDQQRRALHPIVDGCADFFGAGMDGRPPSAAVTDALEQVADWIGLRLSQLDAER